MYKRGRSLVRVPHSLTRRWWTNSMSLILDDGTETRSSGGGTGLEDSPSVVEDHQITTFQTCRKIRPFSLFHQDLKIFILLEHGEIKSGDLTKKAKVLWDTFKDLQGHYVTLSNLYKQLLRMRKLTFPDCLIRIRTTKDHFVRRLNATYGDAISERFSDIVLRWCVVDVSKEPRDSITCQACCLLTCEGGKNPSFNVVSKFFSLGFLQDEVRVTLCRNCEKLQYELMDMASLNAEVYSNLDRLIRWRPKFVDGLFRDLVKDTLGPAIEENRGKIRHEKVVVTLTCCYRAGLIWANEGLKKAEFIDEVKEASQLMLPYYHRWESFFSRKRQPVSPNRTQALVQTFTQILERVH